MKEGKKTSTVIVLALEIAAIVVLHAIKINQSEKSSVIKDANRNAPAVQMDTRVRNPYATYSLAELK
jgi:hypothetical protein